MNTTSPAAVLPKLSVMMFLQYAIWGAWLPLAFPFFVEFRQLSAEEFGSLLALSATGALLAPFVAGQIADRWFSTERFLAFSHLAGAVLVWKLPEQTTWTGLVVVSLLYSVVYAPTIPLTNSLAFHHLPDRDRDFGRIRLWGTVGWIVVGIGMAQWLRLQHSPPGAEDAVVRAAQVAGMGDAFRLSALIGVVMGVYCLFLPHTPPRRDQTSFAPLAALGELRHRRLWTLFLVAFPVSCIHQFYFVHTAPFLGHLDLESPLLDRIFGAGGGGLMTIGQMAEIFVLALVPWFARKLSRKAFLALGLLAYILRFAVFAYLPQVPFLLPALALHGFCFGFFFFIAFMIVDEETTTDVRASAQGLFNFVVVGVGIIAGNYFAGRVHAAATTAGTTDYQLLFGVPLGVAAASLLLLCLLYPGGRRAADTIPH